MTRPIHPDTAIPVPSSVEQRIAKLEYLLQVGNLQPGQIVESMAAAFQGCLLCDGSVYLVSNYPVLAAACPVLVSGGNITVPDFRGRGPIGAGTGTAAGATAHALGSQPTTGAGGEETHLLTADESGIRDHQHYPNDGSGGFFASTKNSGLTYTGIAGGAGGNWANGTTGSPISGAVSASNAHNIMQPITVVNFFIKY